LPARFRRSPSARLPYHAWCCRPTLPLPAQAGPGWADPVARFQASCELRPPAVPRFAAFLVPTQFGCLSMQFARGGLQFRIKSDYTRRPQNASFARQYARKMCAPSFGLVGRTSKSGTRSLRVFCQSKLAMCELIYFAVVSCLWGERAGKRGNGAKRSALAHGKLTDALVTEEQHPGWAQPKGFR